MAQNNQNNDAETGQTDKEEKEKQELQERVIDKGKEVQDVLEKYSQVVGSWKKDKCASCCKGDEVENVFQGAENVILILGNILNPDGTPHEWILQRIEGAANLIKDKNLDLKKTCFLPSGGDVSNSKYTYDKEKWANLYKNAPHPYEATVMRDLLHSKYNIPLSNITREYEARTTLENFYYCMKILYRSNVKHLKNFFVVSSDWHIKRSKINFDILYECEKEIKEKTTYDEDSGIVIRYYQRKQWFKCDNIEFIGIESNSPKEKFAKEEKLINARWVKPQAQEYADYMWKWRDFEEAKENKPSLLKRQDTLAAFAFSTAIEHLYLRLDTAEHGLTKVAHE